MAKGSELKFDETVYNQFRNAIAAGFFYAGGQIEAASKAITPVHGDGSQGGKYATFVPGAKPIGGSLRRSQHTVVYMDGRRLYGEPTDDNQNAIPRYEVEARKGIEAFVGTNIDYAAAVHDGTPTMKPARPFLLDAWNEGRDKVPENVALGFRRSKGPL